MGILKTLWGVLKTLAGLGPFLQWIMEIIEGVKAKMIRREAAEKSKEAIEYAKQTKDTSKLEALFRSKPDSK